MRKDADYFNRISKGKIPDLMGIEILSVEHNTLTCRLAIDPSHLAPNGFLHAAATIALADTACGYGTIANLPDGATGHATIELKSNFVGTVREGALFCRATALHAGRTIQVWDATVTDENGGRTIAHFRCSQMIFHNDQ